MSKLKWAAALVIGAGLGAAVTAVVHNRYRDRIVTALEEAKTKVEDLALTLGFWESGVANRVDEFLVDPDPGPGFPLGGVPPRTRVSSKEDR